tara:strand:- start:268 stop:552 length:285 start_codon:yes stop_codon:yes gene_type:complete
MRILYEQSNGILGVLIPAPKFLDQLTGTDEEKMIHLANKDLPTGTKYEIIDETVTDISDRTFRNAWEYETGSNEKTSQDLTAAELKSYNMKENK